MTDERPDLWRAADLLQMDLRAAQARLVQLRAMLAQIATVPKSSRRMVNGPVTADSCPGCGVGADQHTDDCDLR